MPKDKMPREEGDDASEETDYDKNSKKLANQGNWATPNSQFFAATVSGEK